MKKKKNKNKVGFFHCMIEAIKQGYQTYKDKLNELARRRQLLSAKTDWSMLEYFIQQINDNPKLKIKITLGDGTVLDVSTYKEKKEQVFNSLEY